MSIKLKGTTTGSAVILAAPADTSPTGTEKTFTLPAADGSAGQILATNGAGVLSFVNKLEFDYWHLNADHTTNDATLTNWSRYNQEGAASEIGSGMSQSSGIFTFPGTGKWLVVAAPQFSIDGSDNCVVTTEVTTNNSTFGEAARATDGNNGSGARTGGGIAFAFVDVTDTGNVKVRFRALSLSGSSNVMGNSAFVESGFLFIRLGDT